MLPKIAAITRIRSGTPNAAMIAYSSCVVSKIRPGPSVRMRWAFSSSPRSETCIVPIEPENADSASVAPAMMNQVLTSWLLTTSPRSSASSSRFWVGSSVFSERSVSSAICAHLLGVSSCMMTTK